MEFEKKYEELELEVIVFETEDVIRTSNNYGPFEPKWFVKRKHVNKADPRSSILKGSASVFWNSL